MRNKQYIRDDDGKLPRKLEVICDRWRNFFLSLLGPTSAAFDPTIIEGLSPKPVALSLGLPLIVEEAKQTLRSMANDKAMESNELPWELVKLGLSDISNKILLIFYGIIVVV